MTYHQFDVLVALLRGQQDTSANKAARAVLVDGHTQALAARVPAPIIWTRFWNPPMSE